MELAENPLDLRALARDAAEMVRISMESRHQEFRKRLEKDHIGFVCTNGQLNLCGYVLLDLIQKSGIPMYYAGDFDPEGILIADKLKQRYKDNLHLWKSSVEEYRAILSSSSISEKRLLSLQSCRSEELQALCRELEQYKYSGYQEALLPLYLEEIRNA